MDKWILVINPGGLTTRVSLFDMEKEMVSRELVHDAETLEKCAGVFEQLPLRKAAVEEFIEENGARQRLGSIACRGAPFKPMAAGTYLIDRRLADDIHAGNVATPHVSMLAALIGFELSGEYGVPAYFVDPVSVDEYIDEARLTGVPSIPRTSLWHALNCRAVAQKMAEDLGGKFTEMNFLVGHLGSGITTACFEKGRAVDTCNANSEAPFSPERSGTLPVLELVRLCYGGEYGKDELIRKLTRQSGLYAHLGTKDLPEVLGRIEEGDEKADLVLRSMAYNIAKSLAGLAVAVNGRIDAIALTGAMARSERLVNLLKQRISFLGPVFVYPGQKEMDALAFGVAKVMTGREQAKRY